MSFSTVVLYRHCHCIQTHQLTISIVCSRNPISNDICFFFLFYICFYFYNILLRRPRHRHCSFARSQNSKYHLRDLDRQLYRWPYYFYASPIPFVSLRPCCACLNVVHRDVFISTWCVRVCHMPTLDALVRF